MPGQPASQPACQPASLPARPCACRPPACLNHHAHHALPRLAYLPQRAEIDWDFPITVESVVAQGRYPALGPFRGFRTEDRDLVDRALADDAGEGDSDAASDDDTESAATDSDEQRRGKRRSN